MIGQHDQARFASCVIDWGLDLGGNPAMNLGHFLGRRSGCGEGVRRTDGQAENKTAQ